MWDVLESIYLGFQASLYCLLWDLVNDKSYKLNSHKYKSFADVFNKDSLEDLHDLASLILNTPVKETKMLGCFNIPTKHIKYF